MPKSIVELSDLLDPQKCYTISEILDMINESMSVEYSKRKLYYALKMGYLKYHQLGGANNCYLIRGKDLIDYFFDYIVTNSTDLTDTPTDEVSS